MAFIQYVLNIAASGYEAGYKSRQTRSCSQSDKHSVCPSRAMEKPRARTDFEALESSYLIGLV